VEGKALPFRMIKKLFSHQFGLLGKKIVLAVFLYYKNHQLKQKPLQEILKMF